MNLFLCFSANQSYIFPETTVDASIANDWIVKSKSKIVIDKDNLNTLAGKKV